MPRGAEERAGGAEEDGRALTVVGRMLHAGEAAPRFSLDHSDGTGSLPTAARPVSRLAG